MPTRGFAGRKSTTSGRGLPTSRVEGGMMNMVQAIPAAGVSDKGESNEFVTVALFSAAGLFAAVIAVMSGIVPVVAWF